VAVTAKEGAPKYMVPLCLPDLDQLWTTKTAIKMALLDLHGRHFRYPTF
jgi:hypothetical protein